MFGRNSAVFSTIAAEAPPCFLVLGKGLWLRSCADVLTFWNDTPGRFEHAGGGIDDPTAIAFVAAVCPATSSLASSRAAASLHGDSRIRLLAGGLQSRARDA